MGANFENFCDASYGQPAVRDVSKLHCMKYANYKVDYFFRITVGTGADTGETCAGHGGGGGFRFAHQYQCTLKFQGLLLITDDVETISK